LQEKPVALRRLETHLEPEVLEIIQRSNTMDSIECFATHRITWHQLREMNDRDLQRIGIYRLGDRKRIIDETKKGATGILNKAHAPTTEDIEDNCHPGPSAGAPKTIAAATSPVVAIETTTFPIKNPADEPDEDNECCICMDDSRQIVFLPCGHVCTCKTCGVPLAKCPLCRVDIAQKINLYR
jgi:E3 ubiquitin-protein ligase LRSAM1